jgi:hypothetical protein
MMKKWLKITFIVIAVFIVLVITYAIITIRQVQGLRVELEDKSLEQNAEILMKGDCSKLPIIEQKATTIQRKLNSACFNPLIKTMIKKYSGNRDICFEIKDPTSEMHRMLQQARTFCATK